MTPYGLKFGSRGDVIGCLYSAMNKTVSFTLNGVSVRDVGGGLPRMHHNNTLDLLC